MLPMSVRSLYVVVAVLSAAGCKYEPPPLSVDAARPDAENPPGEFDAAPDAPPGDDVDAAIDATPLIDGAPNTFHITGTLTGLWDGAAIELRATVDGVPVLTTVDADGRFSFPTTFANGASYVISIAAAPMHHSCAIENASGSVDAGDVTDIAVICDGPSVAVAFSAPLPIDFDDSVEAYDLSTSIVVQDTAVTVTAPLATAIQMNGATTLTSGVASPTIRWVPGSNTLELRVEVGVMSRTFTVSMNRGGLPIAQSVYGKSSNSDPSDYLGYSVDAEGERVIVGAWGEKSSSQSNPANNDLTHAGAAYIFRRTGATWVQEKYLKASSIDAYDHFGGAVAISGDVAVVGAYDEKSGSTGINSDDDDDSVTGAGAAYVYRRGPNGWAFEAYLKPAVDIDTSDNFGWSVDVDGDTVVVGMRNDDSAATTIDGNAADNTAGGAGSAFVFVWDGAQWTQQAYLKAPNAQGGDNFGYDVAISANTVVVGAPEEDSCATNVGGDQANEGCTRAGAAYVFQRSGTTWSLDRYLKPSDTVGAMSFGRHVAIDGDVIVAAASDTGAVYAFRRAATWQAPARLEQFATFTRVFDVAVYGDVIAASHATSSSPASLHIYHFAGGAWTYDAEVTGSNTAATDDFGYTAALSGDSVLSGAKDEDGPGRGINPPETGDGAAESGAFYVFH